MPAKRTDKDIKKLCLQIALLKSKGNTSKTIAKTLGLNVMTIYRYMKLEIYKELEAGVKNESIIKINPGNGQNLSERLDIITELEKLYRASTHVVEKITDGRIKEPTSISIMRGLKLMEGILKTLGMATGLIGMNRHVELGSVEKTLDRVVDMINDTSGERLEKIVKSVFDE